MSGDGITLGLVCARSGSVGLPGKNLLRLGGEMLISRAIRIAWEAGCDAVAVSTDYVEGMDFHGSSLGGIATWVERPPELAGPDVGKWEVYQHAVREWEEYTGKTALRIVDVDVTRPLRTAETVRRCLKKLGDLDVPRTRAVAMAVARSDKHPSFDILRRGRLSLSPYDPVDFTSRQQLTPVWLHAGCYAMTRETLFGCTSLWDGWVWSVEVPRIESFDIDDELDWQVVQALHNSMVPA